MRLIDYVNLNENIRFRDLKELNRIKEEGGNAMVFEDIQRSYGVIINLVCQADLNFFSKWGVSKDTAIVKLCINQRDEFVLLEQVGRGSYPISRIKGECINLLREHYDIPLVRLSRSPEVAHNSWRQFTDPRIELWELTIQIQLSRKSMQEMVKMRKELKDLLNRVNLKGYSIEELMRIEECNSLKPKK
ncbi:hypothetical protein H6G33_10470 [Calothrix sp. FACHB-1219]|uniref:hypothetical protein n=1 Tax=unclassified Calothrix TaxID=2619626 RepID=UPI0016855D7B|nr:MULTISPECIES: hypothetical protein [unclassified Calothrix]MBD2201771.1 hypothetical protein [Calothrix sp. FACHB-168]MBD2217457.1 hypothetical protein [Calothrix sp. FACHB-1219]